MTSLSASIERRKAELDAMRPLDPAAVAHLRRLHDLELTYSSNAIEGNTLTLRETAEVVEHGITVGGRPLKDHLEALDHYEAVLWVRDLAEADQPLGEKEICELHRRIVARSQPGIAGVYSPHRRRVAGSAVVFPNPAKTPALMETLGTWLKAAAATPAAAFEAHFRLTEIHPFADGNGRAARLLMNLILIRGGFPPVAIRPQDRSRYLATLETASVAGDFDGYRQFMGERLDATLADYLAALRGEV